MSFRARLFLGFLAGMLVPLAVLAIGVRREMTRQVTAQYDRRLGALAGVVQADLAADAERVGRVVSSVARELAESNRFRLAVTQQDETERAWLLDYAGTAMPMAGLGVLQVMDSAGRVLSSGQFRNEFDRVEPGLAAALARAGTAPALLRARTPEGSVLVVARVDSFEVGGRRFSVIGGRSPDAAALTRFSRDSDLAAALVTPADTIGSLRSGAPGRLLGRFAVPYVDATGDRIATDSARLLLSEPTGPLDELRRRTDRWFAAALAATLLLGLVVAGSLAAQIGRPLTALAGKTAALDLDRLDQDFASGRSDEIGDLSRLLDAMTARLRSSAARLRDAERRATVADVARQVNHDIKNGLAPIRHVLRHLGEVARDEPAKLPSVFAERRGTLDSSVEYLETLARNYARLTPAAGASPARQGAADLNAVAREVVRGAEARGADLRLDLAPSLPPVRGDAVALRRVLENLVGNAVDSLEGGAGSVTVETRALPAGGVRVAIADTGTGMTREQLDRAFDDFYTTRAGGTGLGLSVVRRLVADLSGTLRVETAPGSGSRFIVELPSS
ncbi:MAG TPA: HAMP domain-containing sensor histidine kinase [Gemmatimonadales bacterium]|nr:HAMP domain-containing sensor histidine kinase [Gemmatimonadales bacterium]